MLGQGDLICVPSVSSENIFGTCRCYDPYLTDNSTGLCDIEKSGASRWETANGTLTHIKFLFFQLVFIAKYDGNTTRRTCLCLTNYFLL